MSISKRLRFEVFKRDAFTCQYCGRTPPSVLLECDHIDPRSNGGGDEIDNLVCACFDCNRGKSNVLLAAVPATIEAKIVLLAEKEEQIKAFKKLKRAIKKRKMQVVKSVESLFTEAYPSLEFTPSFQNSIATNFVDVLEYDDLIMAISKAIDKTDDPQNTIKYFCGICWRIIRRNA